MSIFSSQAEMEKISDVLTKYIRLPFSDNTIPGAVMEGVLSYVRGGNVLKTYDFVDVYDSTKKIGWQVKATKASTPLTWKRAKIANKQRLIENSRGSNKGCRILGAAIIQFCNQHAVESMERYGLREIGLSRLVIDDDQSAFYYERKLCDRNKPDIFCADDFEWKWSKQKNGKGKEQLSALHGYCKRTSEKWWAWHGLGENQLHFSGESNWWPKKGNKHRKEFMLPSKVEKISMSDFVKMLDVTAKGHK